MKHILASTFFFSIMFISCEKGPIIIKDIGSLPIIKLSIAEKHLWSPDSGLYIIGNNGISYGCGPIANYNQKWEFPAYIEYIENHKSKFCDNVGFRIKGKCSRNNSMKSFGIYWRKEYGNKNLEYHMFPDITTTFFKRLLLRNSGNDFGKTHIKDASMAIIYKDFANVEYQDYKPCVLYLNDEYWGIYNIREMITPHHFKYHYGVDDDEVDLLKGCELNPSADDGSIDDFMNDVISYINSNDISYDNNYNEISNIIDIDSYIDYIIINTYICNTDWPCGNVKWWRDKTSVDFTKWRWVIFDTDLAFKNLDNVDKIWIGELYGTPFSEEKKDGFFIFNNLIRNNSFKGKFLNRYLFFIETVFEKKRVESIIKANQYRIEKEYDNHQKKWKTLNKSKWEKAIEEMIEFNNRRNNKMKTVIMGLQNESI